MDRLFEQLFQLERVHNLIRLKATGTPKSFAQRLEVSERSLKRLIQQLRVLGFPVGYDSHKQTYYYKKDVKLFFEVLIDGELEFCIKGGKSLQGPKNGTWFQHICSRIR